MCAIQQLHRLGYHHGDIRLPNICFDSNYRAILIDFDQSSRDLEEVEDWEDFGDLLKLCDRGDKVEWVKACNKLIGILTVGSFSDETFDLLRVSSPEHALAAVIQGRK